MSQRADYARFFNPKKSPHTHFDHFDQSYTYVAKHRKRKGIVVWASAINGTYEKADHKGRKLVPRHDRINGTS